MAIQITVKCQKISSANDDLTLSANYNGPPNKPKTTLNYESVDKLSSSAVVMTDMSSETVCNQPAVEIVSPVNKKKSKKCCLLACFGFRRKKKQMKMKNNKENNNGIQKQEEMVALNSLSVSYQTDEIDSDGKDSSGIHVSAERQLCDLLRDANSTAHTRLLQYLEQKRGILVLDMDVLNDDILLVSVICVRQSQALQLSDDCDSGKLLTDISNCLLLDEVLEQCCLTDVQLQVVVDKCQIDQASRELCTTP